VGLIIPASGACMLARPISFIFAVREAELTRPQRGKLVHQEQLANDMASAYYAVLNQDPQFRQDMKRLFNQFHQPPLFGISNREPRIQTLLDEFVDRWKLPRRPVVDTDEERVSLPQMGKVDIWLRWDYCSVCIEGGTLATFLADGGFRIERSFSSRPRQAEPKYVTPYQPEPFAFHPEQGEDWLQARAEAEANLVYESIMQTMDEVRAEALKRGYQIKPARRGPDDLQKIAKRVYYRAVQDLAWDDCAKDEKAPKPTRPAIMKSVTQFADFLEIPLPNHSPWRNEVTRE
jgi:hypothetical protein